MNDSSARVEQENIEKIKFDDLSPEIQEILKKTGGDVFRLLEQYVALENRVNAELEELRKRNAELEAKLAEQTRNAAINVVGEDIISPEVLRDRVSELEKTNTLLNKKIVEAENNAMTDALTGISNKRYFLQEFPKLISLVHRAQISDHEQNEVNQPGKISIIFFDIDHFKQVNDTYGHETGDRVLEKIGKLLRERKLFRNSDCIARYGGEEFVVVLPNCDLDNAKEKAEQIRSEIENLKFDFREEPVTVSIGVSSVDLPMDKQLTEDSLNKLQTGLKELSDKLLYEVKKSGRNNVKAEQMNLSAYIPELADTDTNFPQSASKIIDEIPDGA